MFDGENKKYLIKMPYTWRCNISYLIFILVIIIFIIILIKNI